MENENSGVNTVLIVILLLIVVGALVWFFSRGASPEVPEQEQPGLNIDLNLPADDNGGDAGGNPAANTSPTN